MSFKLLSSETVPLTKDLALKHLDMPASPTERERDESRIKYLKEKIRDGLFICPSWAVAVYNGKSIRMNGQHSSIALTEANGEFPTNLFVHLDKYEVDGREGLAHLSRQFDARKSGRTPQDVANAYKGLCPELSDVDTRYGLIAVKAVSWYRRNIESIPAPTGDDVGELFHDRSLHWFITWIGGLLTAKTPELNREAVVAAVYGTFVTNEAAAREFWLEVAHDSSGDDSSPSHVLSQSLLREKETKDASKRAAAGQLYGMAIRGWNAWRTDKRPTGLSQPKGKPLPEIVG